MFRLSTSYYSTGYTYAEKGVISLTFPSKRVAAVHFLYLAALITTHFTDAEETEMLELE